MDNFICCHVRSATKGAITDENAHPFEFDKLIGMHNGTLRDKKYEHSDKTDSELMFQEMNDEGIIPVLEKLDPWSAYASVIFNKEDGKLYFVRNDQRNLYFGIHATRSVMYWASEDWMIREMVNRNTEKLYKDEVFYFSPDLLYSVHPQDIKAREAFPFQTTKFKPRKYQYNVKQTSSKFKHQERLFLPAPEKNFSNQNQDKWKGTNITPIKKNVLRVDPGKFTINAKTKIPTVFCCGCQARMSPVDVFYATALNASGTTVICRDCDETYTKEYQKDQEVVLN